MSELNEFIADLLNNFSLSTVTDRSWFEIASILSPSVILILTLFGFSFILQKRNWKTVTYIACLLLTLLFLPYELFRQSAALSKAQANIGEMQASLKAFLNNSDLKHMENLADKEVAATMLEEMMGNLDQKEKKEVLLISLLTAENEKQSLRFLEDKHKYFSDEIKSSISEAKREIVNTREPVDKISSDILKQIDGDISILIENKMRSFNQAIDHSLETFQQGINSFVENELKTNEETLVTLTQKGISELKNYTNEAKQEMTNHMKHVNNESLQKLDATQKSIDQLGNMVGSINQDNVVAHLKQLLMSIDSLQKQNKVHLEFSECIRSVGWIDLIGKEEECKKKLHTNMNELISKSY